MAPLLDLRTVPEDVDSLRRSLPVPPVRPSLSAQVLTASLHEIRAAGDNAVRACVESTGAIAPEQFRVDSEVCESALANLAPLVREALESSAGALRAFHRQLDSESLAYEGDGITVVSQRLAAARIGLTLNATDLSKASSVLAVTVAARVAGVQEVVISVEPEGDGGVSQLVLAAAALAGVDEVLALGGVPAIGALAFGTESIKAVDVLCAEQEGLSQLGPLASSAPLRMLRVTSCALRPMLLIDHSAPSQVAAGDVVAATATSSDDVWVVAWQDDVLMALDEQLANLDASEVPSARWQPVLVRDQTQAAALVNVYRPDQVQLLLAEPAEFVPLLNLGAQVLVGTATSPVVIGAFGGPGVLSVEAAGRSSRPLVADDFRYIASAIALDGEALLRLAPYAVALAEAEGHVAGAEAVRRRLGH